MTEIQETLRLISQLLVLLDAMLMMGLLLYAWNSGIKRS